MDRYRFGRGARALALLAPLSLLIPAGCVSLFATLAYIGHQDTEKPECDKLEGKRVAVVCRPVTELQYADSSAAPDLAAMVGELLKAKGTKIVVVSPSEVSRWTDENSWRDYPEIGKALKVDMVVGIDLEQFTIHQGQTLLQGRSHVHLTVFDMKDGGKRVWEKPLPQIVFPPNTPIPESDRGEADFRRQYLGEIAGRVSRYFCPHEPDNDITADTKALDGN
jgi:hypothetical protein